MPITFGKKRPLASFKETSAKYLLLAIRHPERSECAVPPWRDAAEGPGFIYPQIINGGLGHVANGRIAASLE